MTPGPASRAPAPAEAIAELRELYRRTHARTALEAGRCIEAMLAARTRSEVVGPPVFRHCGNVIEVVSKMGPRPQWCSARCWQAAWSQRKRERQAAAAKHGPSPGPDWRYGHDSHG